MAKSVAYQFGVCDGEADAKYADGSITNNPVFNRGFESMFEQDMSQDDQWLALANSERKPKMMRKFMAFALMSPIVLSVVAMESAMEDAIRHGAMAIFMRVGLVSVVVVLFAGAASAKEVFVGELPVSPFVGTEVSTNVPFNVSRNDTTFFTVELEQNWNESNNVQVAFGRDLDADGDLAPEESDLVLGWRRGSCFIEDVENEDRRLDDSAADIEKLTLKMRVVNDSCYSPRLVSFTNELGDRFSDVPVSDFLFKTNWNLLKVTRRGVESAAEWCRITSSYRSFAIRIR